MKKTVMLFAFAAAVLALPAEAGVTLSSSCISGNGDVRTQLSRVGDSTARMEFKNMSDKPLVCGFLYKSQEGRTVGSDTVSVDPGDHAGAQVSGDIAEGHSEAVCFEAAPPSGADTAKDCIAQWAQQVGN